MNSPFNLLPSQVSPDTPAEALDAIRAQWLTEAHAACYLTTITTVTRILGRPVNFPVARHGIAHPYELNAYARVVAVLEDVPGQWNRSRQNYDNLTRVTVKLCSPNHPFYRGDTVAYWRMFNHRQEPERDGFFVPGDWLIPFLEDAPYTARVLNDQLAAETERERRDLYEQLTITLKWE